MSTRRRTLLAGLSILILSAGCSNLEKDLLPTMQHLNNEACETCHPRYPQTKNHVLHMYDTTMESPMPLGCKDCHKGYVDSLGWVEPSFHRNGIIDTSQADCDYCHTYRKTCQDSWCHLSPPDTSPRLTKIHNHYTLQNMKCDECHKGYDLDKKICPVELHDNGKVDVIFDVSIKTGFPVLPVFSNDSCYNLYCHGAFTNGGKEAVAVNDTKPQGAPAQCGFCHELQGLYTWTTGHSNEGISYDKFLDCLVCHDNFSANQLATVDSLHRNGKIDTIPKADRVQ